MVVKKQWWRGELRCCHMSHSPRRVVDHRNKKRLSCPRHAGRYNASLQCSVDTAGYSWTWLQWRYDLIGWYHGTGHVQSSRVIRQDGSTLLMPCKTSFAI
jgi:hypothetical protein